MSDRSAQAYMRIAKHWKELQKAQSSPLFSIDAALKFLARRKSDGKDVAPADEAVTAELPEDERDEEAAVVEPEPATIADGDDAPGDARQTTEDDDGGTYQETADEPQEVAEEELPPVTDDQIAAADSFVAAVGGLEQAARALVARSIKGGGNDGLKSVMAAAALVRGYRRLAARVAPCRLARRSPGRHRQLPVPVVLVRGEPKGRRGRAPSLATVATDRRRVPPCNVIWRAGCEPPWARMARRSSC